MPPSYVAIAPRAGHRCEYCRAPEELTNFRFFVDHIIPRSVAPELVDSVDNLALCCPPCNLYKADQTHATDPETGEHEPLFHPRRQRWTEHFDWSPDGVEVVGRTAVGRATIEALKLNAPAQRRARSFWLTTERFP